jgi:hypothetical protein
MIPAIQNKWKRRPTGWSPFHQTNTRIYKEAYFALTAAKFRVTFEDLSVMVTPM